MTDNMAFLLKIGSGDPIVYRTIAGLRSSRISLEKGAVQITAAGIFLGSAAEAQVRANAMAGTLDNYELSFESGEKLRGRLLIQKLDYAGDLHGERNYTINLSGADCYYD